MAMRFTRSSPAAARRPQRKLFWLNSTATPFSSIARSSEARDLVFVLVGEKLRVVAGYGLGKFRGT
jgi:hypothetical protein